VLSRDVELKASYAAEMAFLELGREVILGMQVPSIFFMFRF
jgi:hypothetical protein